MLFLLSDRDFCDGPLTGFMDDSFVIPQSERSQFRARGPVIRVKNASNPQTFRDLDVYVVNLNKTVERPIWVDGFGSQLRFPLS